MLREKRSSLILNQRVLLSHHVEAVLLKSSAENGGVRLYVL